MKMTNSTAEYSLTKKFFKGLVWNQLRYYVIFPLTFLLSIVLARGLGPSDYGIYVGLMAVMGILGLVSSFGLEAVSSISLPKLNLEESPDKASYLIKRLLITRTIATILTLFIFFLSAQQLFAFFMSKGIIINNFGRIKFLLAIYFLILNINSILRSFYRGFVRFKMLSIIDTMVYSMDLILCFLIFKVTKSLGFVFAVFIFTQLITTFFLFYGLRNYFLQKSNKFIFRDINALAITLYGTRVVQYGLDYQKDILLIGFFLPNPMTIGFYGIAAKLSTVFNSLLTIGFGDVTLPSFSETFIKRGKDGLKKIWYVFMRLEMFLTIPILVFVLFNANDIILLFYSNKYLPAVPIFKVLSVLLLISSGFLGGGTSQKILYAMNKQKIAFLITLTAGILNILLSIILIPKYNVLGAAYATGFSMIIWRLSELSISIRLLNANFPFLFLLKIVAAVFISIYISGIIIVNSLLSLSLSSMLFLFSYIMVLYLIKPFNSNDRDRLNNVNLRLAKHLNYFCKS